ncbi:PAS domain S-box protein [Leptolyngbya sp. NIES-2104]|uniref:PAS domain S-box protein n=1 Tax=Leptolyngbya sp. NIES-2104 TaxID=1552121 RepID=UPI0006EC9D78|nr:PAS domain S-box protein [Leptolyngbya sp. NIES-2104]GAP99036.1 circadian input kinase A [Leptolyngbya sp. NIES-2104]
MIGEIEQTALELWQVLDRVAAPIFIKDRQHRVIFANRALCQRSHYSLPEFLENVDRILSAEIRDDEAIFLTGTQVTQSGYLHDATGIAQEISIVKAITYDAVGTPYIVATIADVLTQPKATQLEQEIQERKAAEAALVRSQQRLTLLIQQSPFMFVEWTAQYQIQTWNATAARVFGYRRSEAVGRSLDEILPELAREEVLNQIAPLLTQSGVTQQVQTHQTQSGQTIVCEWYHYPLLAPNGSVLSIVSMGIDITDRVQSEAERRQAEIARLKSEKRLSLLIQHAPLAIIEWTPELLVKDWNPAAERMFGTSRIEAIGQSCDRWTPEKVQPEMNKVITKLIECKGGTHNINENIRSNGEIITCEWYNNQILDFDGNAIGIVSMVMDITDRIRLETEREQTAIALKQSESQLRQQTQELENAFKQLQKTQAQLIQNEKMSSLGQLVAGIAHEINNPVSFIYGNVEPAKQYIEDLLHAIHLYETDHPLPSERIAEQLQDLDLEFTRHDLFKLLDSMGTGAERIRDIVQSLRSFSRHDEADLKAVDLHEGIDSTLMLLQHLLKSNRASGNPILRPTIQVIKQYDKLPKVQCYAGLLNQVLMNLFSNAIEAINDRWQAEEIDFTPTIEIQTSLFQETETAEWVRIAIADNGIGMTTATHRRLFDPFFTTKPVGQGSGLGLSVSYQIVTEQHEGRLKCERTCDRGATFVIEIPVKQLLWS